MLKVEAKRNSQFREKWKKRNRQIAPSAIELQLTFSRTESAL